MKDLRKGSFDDKIDQYLGGTPGLEPRAGANPAQALPRGTRAQTEESPPPEEVIAQAKAAMSIAGSSPSDSVSEGSPIEIVNEGLSEPIELPIKTAPVKGSVPPPPMEDDAPTLTGSAAAVGSPAQSRTKTAERGSKSQATPPAGNVVIRATQARGAQPPPIPGRGVPSSRDSYPQIEISEEDESSGRLRARDTAVDELADSTVPVRQGQRPASHGAAALPPMKSPSRPSIQPPVVQSRQGTPSDEDLSAPVEIYAPAPPSVEAPPGERSERPGQYSVSRRDGAAPIREKTGRIAAINPQQSIPAGLGRPPKSGSGAVPVLQSKSGSGSIPAVQRDAGSGSVRVPRDQVPAPSTGRSPTPGTPQQTSRIPQVQPNRVHVTAPIQNRSGQPAAPNPSSGVVMTRPAVIVGTPAKPPPSPPPQSRVRKAREDEGRGFGQGLISEKSLDEVILAYLSEDAEDK
jgi:hypothetical protein